MAGPLPRGDSHHFGRRVRVLARRVEKPRSVFWEWLVLGRESPLRRLLMREAERDALGAGAFDFLPALRFGRSRSGVGGWVERVELAPLGRLAQGEKGALAGVTGRLLALSAWLGIADLHWENLVLGRGGRGELVFAPLDIEIMLSELSLPTETKLLPDADPEIVAVCRHAAGVRRVLPFLGKPVAGPELVRMAAAYRTTLAFLGRHSIAIAGAIEGAPGFRAAPIRVCLRGTGDYVLAESAPPWPPLLDAELEQLERGDIPYFFRLYGRPGIHYYRNRALTAWKTLPARGDVPRLEPLLSLRRGLRAGSRQALANEGTFALLGAFDHPELEGRHEHDGLAVTFGRRGIVVELPGGERLRSRRDLSRWVGSVYLGCRCGEVRAPFVPPVTRCALAL
jgi:hypothetical protein